MLKISDDIRFLADVKVQLKAYSAEFQVECRLLDMDVVDDVQARQNKGELTPDAFIGTWLTGWPEGQVLDADGAPLPFNDANVARLLNRPGMKMALVRAFWSGYEEGHRGKLRAAARWLLNAGDAAAPPAESTKMDDATMAEFERLGVPREQLLAGAELRRIEAAAAAPKAPAAPLSVARHLYPAVRLASALRTQVRVVAGGAGLLYLGLDYARLDGTKRDLGLPMRGPKSARLLRDFQTVEQEMLRVWNERAVAGAATSAPQA